MPKVEDAREAEKMVRSRYEILDSQPYEFKVYKRGYTWVVTYNLLNVLDTERHEVHINARTGNMLTIRWSSISRKHSTPSRMTFEAKPRD